jgi:hypothetical protein
VPLFQVLPVWAQALERTGLPEPQAALVSPTRPEQQA